MGRAGFLAKGLDYLVGLVLQLECLGVGLVALAPQPEDLRVDLVLANLGNLFLPMILSESELITIAVLPSFFLEVPFTLALYLATLDTDFALGLAALDATGILVGKCADLILGLPALDVDAVGLSAIRHSTNCQNFVS